MSRTLRSFLPLDVDPDVATAAFTGDPAHWLPDTARQVGPDHFVLDVGAAGLERSVTLTVGTPWHVGTTWWRSCTWEPAADPGDAVTVTRLLPRLDAELGLSLRAGGRATLLLDGRYDPPGGRLGDAVDAVAMNRVARATVDRLLAEVARQLSAAQTAPVTH